MDWSTLLSVVVGGLIAVIPILINNRFQSRERDKDREEVRKETRLQTREKWIERDVLKIMDSIEKLIAILVEHENIDFQISQTKRQRDMGFLTEKEYNKQMSTIHQKIPFEINQANQMVKTIGMLIKSFDDQDILSAFEEFRTSMNLILHAGSESVTQALDEETPETRITSELWSRAMKDTGRLQHVLREILISIHDD